MWVVSFLVIVVLAPCIQAVLVVSNGTEETQNVQAMIMEACAAVRDPKSCIQNLESDVQKMGPASPNSVVHAALKTSLKEARVAIEMITQFTTLSFTYREQLAIEDCKELLDLSVSELAWSLAEMTKLRAGNRVPHLEGNLKAWLSAALSNQDTCLEGFQGTDRHVEHFIRGSLKQVSQLIGNVLGLYTQLHAALPSRPPPPRNSTRFPAWMAEGDRGLVDFNPLGMHVDAVVAADGSGQFRTITEAINEAPNYGRRRYVIHIKKGVYRENIDMKKKKTNIMFVGDGMGSTVVTASRNFLQGWTTFRTATVAVSGRGFIARDMTFRNTAGPHNRQAVALRVDSDQSAFFRCSVEGYQDTLYAHSLRQFYRECNVYGTIDFIFGNGAAVLQSCNIFTRVPLPMQKVTITAQGRKNPNQSTGFSIQDSFVMATQPTYLGRPWKQYSRTVFMNTYMSGQVDPRGWLEWYGDFALNTLWYGEYGNRGPGASLSGRVKWPGYHIINDASLANSFTVGRFIDGMSWLPATGVKFSAGLNH